MSNLDLLRETKEYGEEKYTENYQEKKCNCSCKKKGIEIIKEKNHKN